MSLLGSALAWLHRSWAFRFMEPVFLPGLLLVHSLRLIEEPPTWLLMGLAVVVLWASASVVLGGQLQWLRRPRRDWSRPILEQVQDDLREDVPLEERSGLKRIDQPPPPAPVAAIIRRLGGPMPPLFDAACQLLLVLSVGAAAANGYFNEDVPLDHLMTQAGLPGLGLTRWDLALVLAGVGLLTSLRLWASARRAEFDGEASPAPVEAYG